jgi:hypothetical protein
MSREVIDTNVLTIASAPSEDWFHPRIPLSELRLVFKVLQWVQAFGAAVGRHLVMDVGGTILEEYGSARNMPDHGMYGRQVVQAKFDRGQVHFVDLTYWNNGFERVAHLPKEVEALVHDLGDRKMLAAAYEASAQLVNACDGDWTEPPVVQALDLLELRLVQVLSDAERVHCRTRGPGP